MTQVIVSTDTPLTSIAQMLNSIVEQGGDVSTSDALWAIAQQMDSAIQAQQEVIATQNEMIHKQKAIIAGYKQMAEEYQKQRDEIADELALVIQKITNADESSYLVQDVKALLEVKYAEGWEQQNLYDMVLRLKGAWELEDVKRLADLMSSDTYEGGKIFESHQIITFRRELLKLVRDMDETEDE